MHLDMPCSDGDNFQWALCDPQALVQLCLRESVALQDWFEEAWLRQPATQSEPWHVLIGFDECTPGNKLALRNERKCMVLNFTFREFGNHLSKNCSWLTPIVVRTSAISLVAGGRSAMLRKYLHLHLFGEKGQQTNGWDLSWHGLSRRVFAKVPNILADGDGLRMCLQWGGQGCLKPCWRHWDVMKLGSGRAGHAPDGDHVEISCDEPHRHQLWGEAALRDAIDTILLVRDAVQRDEMPNARLLEVQQGFGFSATREGLLADATLYRALQHYRRCAMIGCTASWLMNHFCKRLGHRC